MIEARNLVVHTYSEDLAERIFDEIHRFAPELRRTYDFLKNKFHLCKWCFIGGVPFQYRERGFGGPPMLGSPLATARGTELLAHLHRSNKFTDVLAIER
jgi:hypothetical protein